MMQLSQVVQAVNGQQVGRDVLLKNISINARENCHGRLFVALKGENFDAHQFISQAEQAGASAVMVQQEVDTHLPMVLVTSTHQALIDLASWWRSQFVLPVIGITGSVGKTTVKEMLACIFAEVGQGVVTKGNLNNEIGVPLTLMELTADDRYAIVEMGMNHAGEIGRLSAMAKPTVALVNNAAAAHLEGLGSIDAVAKAKGEIYQGLSADGIAVINQDDDYAELWSTLTKGRAIIRFGLSSDADVSASYKEKKGGLVIKAEVRGQKMKIKLNTVGEHSVRNALAAVAVAISVNIPIDKIEAGLANFTPVSGRLNIETIGSVDVIDDTYNANPASMRAAIDVLVSNYQSTLIVGDMGELGSAADTEHKALGQYAAAKGVKALYAVGDFASIVVSGFGAKLGTKFGTEANSFETQTALIEHLSQQQLTGTFLVKGSRSAKMERVVHALHKQLLNNQSGDTLFSSDRSKH
jgi:UDP-N-acetylmuramoyl-tripeptide--D-alanyl-D-alanine ligase